MTLPTLRLPKFNDSGRRSVRLLPSTKAEPRRCSTLAAFAAFSSAPSLSYSRRSYQLGGVLHDLIMRKRLFEGSDEPYARLVEAVKNETPQISADDGPLELVLLAKNCLSKKPELRPRYVNWDSFEPHEGASDTARLRDRIVRRTAYARERAVAVTAADSVSVDRARAEKRALQEVTGKLSVLLRTLCAGIDLLPPFSIDERFDSNSPRSTLLLTFAKAHGGNCS